MGRLAVTVASELLLPMNDEQRAWVSMIRVLVSVTCSWKRLRYALYKCSIVMELTSTKIWITGLAQRVRRKLLSSLCDTALGYRDSDTHV